MKKKILLPLLFTLISTLISSCASATAGIAVSNIPLENKDYEVLGPAFASVRWFSFDIALIGVPLSPPPVDKAISMLLSQHNGDAVINIRYSTDRYILGPISMHRFNVFGDVVRLENSKDRKK